jgi:signal transduction histidine kinase
VLNLADKAEGQSFTPADLELARDMAGQVAGLVHFSVLHSRLLAAHQRLRAEQREKDDLLHLIIHDLKAPLTAAREALGLLGPAGGLDEAERGQFLALAEADLELLWRRITNLLDLQRMDQERLPVQPAPLRLAAIAQEAAARLAPTARVRGVELTLALGDDPEVIADEDLVERVVVNLLFNALKVSSPEEGGGGRVALRVALAKAGALVEVVDSGPGVDPALGERIFERHVQGAPRRGSSGLGLYFCRRAAALMGGAVAYVNPPQGGARFTLTLPTAAA